MSEMRIVCAEVHGGRRGVRSAAAAVAAVLHDPKHRDPRTSARCDGIHARSFMRDMCVRFSWRTVQLARGAAGGVSERRLVAARRVDSIRFACAFDRVEVGIESTNEVRTSTHRSHTPSHIVPSNDLDERRRVSRCDRSAASRRNASAQRDSTRRTGRRCVPRS
jgi:hypothetical protein